MTIIRDQVGKEVVLPGNVLPSYGTPVTVPNGTGQMGNATWQNGIAVPIPKST
jgi:hypothetical protein